MNFCNKNINHLEKEKSDELVNYIGNIKFSNCLMNASGTSTYFSELKEIQDSNAAAIVMKTCTFEQRKGNPLPRFAKLPFNCSIQSMGLPNPGHKESIEIAIKLKNLNDKKPIIASIACIDAKSDEFLKMLELFDEKSDLIEINLSCPNVEKSPIGYSICLTKEVLEKISKLKIKTKIGLKLPYYSTTEQCFEMAKLFKQHNITFITCCNSLSGLVIDNEGKTYIKPKEGVGGIGGYFLKPFSLFNVKEFYKYSDNKFSIIGVGGIFSGKDVLDYILAGADCVQIGTAYVAEGTTCFYRINNELKKILKIHNFKSIKEAKGKLRII